MSSRKEKHLDSAQKFLVKGQLDKAVREYEQAVALDPKDVRVRQKFAELLVRAGRREEALREFEVIGKFYADNGFYLKAIAVYKQIQKIDPTTITISLTLAMLNEKQGLVGNALAEYKVVFDHYEKTGQLVEAVGVLEKMLGADKDNLNIRLKLADTRHRAGFADEAYHDFTDLARELRAKGDEAAFGRICERIGILFPDRKEFLLSIAEDQIKAGTPAAAVAILRQLVGDPRWNPRALYLLADAARLTGDGKTARMAYSQIVKGYPGELMALKGLLFALRSEGDVEEGVRLLSRFEADLLQTEPDTLEQFYYSFNELAPQHPGIADGLARVKTALGRIEEAAVPEPDESVASEKPSFAAAPAGAVTRPGLAEETVDEFPWEDEIDISFDDEDASGEGDVVEMEPFPLQDSFDDADVSGAGEFATVPAASSLFEPRDDIAGGIDLEHGGEGANWYDGFSADGGTEEIELDVSEFSAGADDWLSGAGRVSPEEKNQQVRGESFSLDFTDDELDGIIPPAPSVPEKRDKYGLEGLFSAFKKGVGEQLGQDDTESHYNLGIAYKEMGLYDDAVNEFQAASRDPRRRVDCITLQGICYREKGEPSRAEALFSMGLQLPGLSDEERLCLKYELALLHETAANYEKALTEFRVIYALNPDFRDTVRKIARLQRGDEALDLADIELVDLDVTE
ncbi:MAG: tetratricopeptide repeat protein [Desulfuromonadales bacterium]|nr:MAG: tetratricopeptide repeat protein [Desulfuromonadales bacterium]